MQTVSSRTLISGPGSSMRKFDEFLSISFEIGHSK